jgi:hypothetical protein
VTQVLRDGAQTGALAKALIYRNPSDASLSLDVEISFFINTGDRYKPLIQHHPVS